MPVAELHPDTAEAALPDLARLLAACVAGGASVNFLQPFTADQAEAWWRARVLPGLIRRDRRVLVARLGAAIIGTAQLDLATPPNQAHRADVSKVLVHPDARRRGVALEVEWNNKDPFFDRDLNNFRLLFDLRAIQVGVIITRAAELQKIFRTLGKGTSFGAATTHHEKLWPKLEGGGGGGCPILTFAITPRLYVDDGDEAVAAAKAREAARKTGGS